LACAAVVDHCLARRLGHLVDVAQNVLDVLARQVGMTLQRRVQVVDIRGVVLVVMDLHRLGVDVRLERGVVVR